MFKLAKIALVCMLFASTEAALADDVYRCGKVYQDSPCAGGNSWPMNEKPFQPSVTQHPSKTVTISGNKPYAKPKKMLSKRKPVAVPKPSEPAVEIETTQNTTPTDNPIAAAQAVMAPSENPAPAADPAPAKVVDKPAEAQPAQKMAEKEVVADEQGVCSSLKAGLKNISNQKAKGGGAATMKDLNQQQRNLEGAMHSAGC
jgi:hypothetical protein